MQFSNKKTFFVVSVFLACFFCFDASVAYAATTANAQAYVAVEQPNGKYVFGGFFTEYNGVVRNGIARANADGSVDESFSSPLQYNVYVSDVAIQSDGKIIVVGRWDNDPSASSFSTIIRLNSDGTIDPTFTPGSGADDMILAVELQSNGKIVIGGYFTSYDGENRGRIARLNADGTLDTSFVSTSGASGDVNDLVIQSDGKIVIGGSFTTYNGASRNRVARINTDGSNDATFSPGTGANSYITSVDLQSDGKVIIAGNFSSVAGTTRNRLARLNTNGSHDTTFSPGTGLNGLVEDIDVQTDDKVVVGGVFSLYNGVNRQYLARANANGSLDTGFSVGTGPDQSLDMASVLSDGDIFISGAYLSSYNGVNMDHIIRLNGDGTLDANFDGGPVDAPTVIIESVPDRALWNFDESISVFVTGNVVEIGRAHV